MSASDVATKKAEVAKKLNFGEWFKCSEGSGIDKDKLEATVKKFKNPKATLTDEEKEILLKAFSVDEGKLESSMGKGYIKFANPYVCRTLTYKDASGAEKEISLGDRKIDSYQGFKALESGYGILCSKFGFKDVGLKYLSRGERQPNKYANLDENKTKENQELLGRSMGK